MSTRIGRNRVLFVLAILLAVTGAFLLTRTTEAGWAFDYDSQGRLTKVVDFGGKVTRIRYELGEKNRVVRAVKRLPGGGRAIYEFDRFGRRTGMEDATGSVRYGYDGFSRLISLRRSGLPSLSYAYDTEGRTTTLELDGAWVVRYRYDFVGRLSRIDTPRGSFSYDYRPTEGKLIRTAPNGLMTVFEFGPDSSLQSILHAAADGHILSRFSYSYRPDRLIRAIVSEEPPTGIRKQISYEYDTRHRLTAVVDEDGGRIEYGYDASGNRTEVRRAGAPPLTSRHDWAGRLLKHNNRPVDHDASGNLISHSAGPAKTAFDYDGMNRIRAASTGQSKAQYQHDADGNLVARTVEGRKTLFLPDPFAGSWRPLVSVDALGNRSFFIWQGNVPLAVFTGEGAEFYLHDHLGSVRLAADPSGGIVRRFDYDAFGVPEQPYQPAEFRPGFASLFYDAAASVYLARVRTYDPRLAQFLQGEPPLTVPDGSPATLSAYGYCGGDPVNYLDPDGAWPQSVGEAFRGLSQLLDPSYAAQWYAGKAEAALAGAQGGWVLAGMQATAYDLLGGLAAMAGGKPASEMQLRAQVLWTLATFGGLPQAGASAAIKAVSVFSTFLASLVHLKEGDFRKAGLDILSLGGTALGMRSKDLLLRPVFAGAQGEFAFLHPEILNRAKALAWISDAIRFSLWMKKPFSVFGQEMSMLGLGGGRNGELARTDAGRRGSSGSGVKPVLEARDRDRFDPYRWRRQEYFFPPPDPPPGCPPICPPFGGAGMEAGSMDVPPPGCPPFCEGFGGAGIDPGGPPLLPSPVGGVYLSGAGEALKSLGPLEGFAYDKETGRWALLSASGSEIGLPPLRLDDLVTVFRAVYEQGEAPSVSIDPDPQEPEGPVMLVRHGPGTAGTYVGWVLFEADRVMKSYSQGYDNLTCRELRSQVPGYRNLMQLGFSQPGGNNAPPVWERFWIVPAKVRFRQSQGGNLALLDLGLRVEAQRMVLRNGKLVPAPDARPSKEAEQFRTWFTEHYDEVSAEQTLLPPKETGASVPVRFFRELRRIALIAAIAERMRQQGVPLPSWMEEYAPTPCPTPPATPAIVVEAADGAPGCLAQFGKIWKPRGRRYVRIYGGVRLTLEAADVETLADSAEAEAAAKAVLPALTAASPAAAPVQPEGTPHRAVVLPGADTRDFLACRLEHTDLTVPVQNDAEITLGRKFNSFFRPSDVFGAVWTLDLPRLVQGREPIARSGDKTIYKTVFQLSSPLASCSARFREIKPVPEVNGQLMVPDAAGGILGLADANDPLIGSATRVLLFRSGERWHFDQDGALVASRSGVLTVVYRRDPQHRVRRIEGWYVNRLRAAIELDYDGAGRVVAGRGSNGAMVLYDYDAAGTLRRAERPGGTLEYRYQDGLVSEVLGGGKVLRQFEYGPRGQLVRERRPDGADLTYRIASGPSGVQLVAENGRERETIEYAAQKPVLRIFPDGARVEWQRSPGGSEVTTLTAPGGEQYAVTTSPDGARQSWRSPEGGVYEVQHDAGERVVAIRQNGYMALSQDWHADGQLARAVFESFAIHPKYRDGGVLSEVLVTEPGEGPRFSHWMRVEYDEMGRPQRMQDNSGSDVRFGYDAAGGPSAVVSGRAGVELSRDGAGRIDSVKTSWGYRQDYTYSSDDQLRNVQLTAGDQHALIEFDQGRPVTIRQYDGGQTRISYYPRGPSKDLVREIRPPDNQGCVYEYNERHLLRSVSCDGAYRLDYSYDANGRLSGVRRSRASR